jgi:hypothetical protein
MARAPLTYRKVRDKVHHTAWTDVEVSFTA